MSRYLKLIFLFVLASCGGEDPNPVDLGYDYFPINNLKRIYQVSETNYNLEGPQTVSYQIRESWSDTIRNADSEIVLILKRERRSDETESWKQDSLWSARKTNQFVSLSENNTTFVKLSFPVSPGREWDGNAYNTQSESYYEYISTESGSLMTEFLDSAMITVQIAAVPDNLSYRDERFEVYAKGLGLIEKNYIRVTYCSVNCDSVKQIESGSILNQYLIGYEE